MCYLNSIILRLPQPDDSTADKETENYIGGRPGSGKDLNYQLLCELDFHVVVQTNCRL